MGDMSERDYRPGLPEMPNQIRKLPITRGYPTPWFVASVKGQYDFRIMDGRKVPIAIKKRLCWICGQQLGKEFTFPIGPMCAVNRTTAEPPSHPECAEWAAHACPFLLQKEGRRREAGLPTEARPPAGEMIRRQPGVVLLWRTNSYTLFSDGRGGVLIRIGKPLGVSWLREGREATRDEVEESINSGLPLLRDKCQSLAELRHLQAAVSAVGRLLPMEEVRV